MKNQFDVGAFNRIFLDLIESTEGDWKRSWIKVGGDLPRNVETGRYFGGANLWVLALTAMVKGYSSDLWGTLPTWNRVKGGIIAGEKSTKVYFTQFVEDKDNPKIKRVWTKVYSEFNLSQVSGYIPPEGPVKLYQTVGSQIVTDIVSKVGVPVSYGGNRAAYSQRMDKIAMPLPGQFKDQIQFDCTLLHELIHSTGHPERLARLSDDPEQYDRSSDKYATEEIVAEFGSAALGAILGIEQRPIENHFQYVNAWKEGLAADENFFLDAFKVSWEAVRWICHKAELDVKFTEDKHKEEETEKLQ